jgi:hypothetical protein
MKVTTVATATKTAVQVAWFVIELRAIDVPSSDAPATKTEAATALISQSSARLQQEGQERTDRARRRGP